MEKMALWVLVIGLVGTVVGLSLAGKRVFFLFRLITSGQPAPDRIKGVTGKIALALKTQVVEVFGQKKLLKWSIPGTAHFFVFWAFLILGTVYFEAYASLITRDAQWSWLVFNNWAVLGFLQDFIAVMCLAGIFAFWQIRMKEAPEKLGRDSRFYKSHTSGAYFVLFMIFNVIWTLFLFRGAVAARDIAQEKVTGEAEGYGWGAFVSHALGHVLPDSSVLIGVGLLLHIGVMLVFLVDVVNSKHLHIFIAPLNVLFGRRPKALGALKPLMNDGKAVTLDDVDDLDEDSKLGVGSIEDFSWKGLLDMATCTECGRCQSQCPAWNTEKPLSPKLLIMALRDSAFARGDYTLATDAQKEKLLAGSDTLTKEAERPLIGESGDDWFYMPENGGGVIDPDVLWSCVTCGACVEQCPVDIEHVDHIVDMRRYQVLVESNFPAELNGLFKGMENKGNPWNMSSSARMDWAKGLDFEVKVVGETIESLDEVEWLFWVGCAGAYEDRAKKTTRAVAELLDMAGVTFGVLGNGETCTGDSARRAGNEFLFQGLAQENIETFKQYKVKKVVSTCAHCYNTLKNEYREFGIELDVIHHTQLLNTLVRDGKLTPVKGGAGSHKRKITYHDPCYIGRHNGIYTPPRDLLQILPGAEYVEMERNSERSFCCGAGGARMWMEENIGSRINENRSNEAIGTGADQIAVGCPFCRVMLSDGLTSAQDKGTAREEVEVLDVAQMLLASVKDERATRYLPGEGPESGAAPAAKKKADAEPAEKDVATKAEPEAGDETITEDTVVETADAGPAAKASGGSSLFDDASSMFDEPEAKAAPKTADESKAPAEEAKAAKPESSGGSLFDVGADEGKAAEAKPAEKDTPDVEPVETKAAEDKKPDTDLGSGGSLFDLGGDDAPAETKPAEKPAAKKKATPDVEPVETKAAEKKPAASKPDVDLGGGGSLFDLDAPEPETAKPAKPAAKADKAEDKAPDVEPVETPAASKEPTADLGSGGSLFDIAAPEPAAKAAPAPKEPEVDPVEAPATDAATEPQEPTEPAEKPESGLSAGAALSASATSMAGDDADLEPTKAEAVVEEDAADTAEDATPDVEPVETQPADTEPEPDEKPAAPKPASNGEAHQPKTDVDISESSSLFDL